MVPDPLDDLDGASIPQLAELLDHDDPRVRADAACALGDRVRTREVDELDPAVRQKVAVLLEDREPFVRFEAAIALAEVQDHRGTPFLLSVMGRRSVRLDAIRALGTMRDPVAVEPLRQFMQRWLLPWADRLQAAAALCALGDAAGASYLADKLNSRKLAERAAAVHFLGESRHPNGRDMLEALLADANEPLRDTAARALGLLGDAEAIPALQHAREQAHARSDDELCADIDAAIALLQRPRPT